jgi:hypothetical protein
MTGIKELPETIKKVAEILPSIEKILTFLKDHWRAVTAVLGVGAVYSVAWYAAFRSPQETIKGYLCDITDRRIQSAWERFHPNFRQSRWASDFSEFTSGYTNTISDTIVEINTEDESWLPYKIATALFSNTVDVTALSKATDNVDGKACVVSAPPTICLVAQLVDPVTYQVIIHGDDFPIKSAGDRRKLVQVSRQLKSRFTLQRDGFRKPWTIIDVHLNEIRISL